MSRTNMLPATNLGLRSGAERLGQSLGRLSIILIVGLVSLEVQAQETQRSSDANSFFDDFKTLDRRRWYISDGWSNGDIQGCTWSGNNVRATESSIELVLNDDASATRSPLSLPTLVPRMALGARTMKSTSSSLARLHVQFNSISLPMLEARMSARSSWTSTHRPP
jgi:hypothetical protein